LLALLNLRRTDLMYLYYYFDFTKQIFQQIAPKGTQANLNTIIVGNFKIPLPLSRTARDCGDFANH
jgi:restriction endonuclease S subunit